jgi:hypothetical protein
MDAEYSQEEPGFCLLSAKVYCLNRLYSEHAQLQSHPLTRSALEQIKTSFADGPPPAEEEIVSRSRFPYDPEREQIRKFLSGKRWTELSIEEFDGYIGDEDAILTFLTPQAFSYYLPAFLTVSLTDHRRADTTLWRFTLFSDPGFAELQAGWIGGLSTPQLEAVESTARALEAVYGPNDVYSDAVLDIQRIKRERGASS